ncbi:hypothetical protein [Saccharicrinis aurantiacus]|uniref:hypothetical protein n=1 Tax=Saccharicrinis aurantiacus TaxID=1849719 RepID=UPI001115181A|nr:hypothetical protein [Saccharicrinis aurantiacus]
MKQEMEPACRQRQGKEIQGCFTNNFLIYLKLKCGWRIFRQSLQLASLTKALNKTKAFCKEASLQGALKQITNKKSPEAMCNGALNCILLKCLFSSF